MRKRAFFMLGVALMVSLAAASAVLAAGPTPQRLVPHKAPVHSAGTHVPLSMTQDAAEVGADAQSKPRLSMSVPATGPCTVTGVVLDYAGNTVAGAEVELYYEASGLYYFFGATTTGSQGAFSFTDVPETTGGEIDIGYFGGTVSAFTWRTGLTFTAAGPNDFTLQPGQTNVTLIDDWDDGVPDFSPWMPVELYGSGGGSFVALNTATDTALATAPDIEYGVIYPFMNSGIEAFPNPVVAVTPGVTGGSIEFKESEARDVFVSAPYWASGDRGRTASLRFVNWPAGYSVRTTGYSDYEARARKSWAAFTTSGSTMTRKRGVPADTPAGYNYNFVLTRKDSGSMLQLVVPYQVAPLKSSKTSISRGGKFQLRGRVPVEGRYGTTPGKKKTVLLYKRTTSAGQPKNWDARKSGWTKVGYRTTDGNGYYKTRYFRPGRTTWYVVRYPGDNEYYRAYSSVIKVKVR